MTPQEGFRRQLLERIIDPARIAAPKPSSSEFHSPSLDASSGLKNALKLTLGRYYRWMVLAFSPVLPRVGRYSSLSKLKTEIFTLADSEKVVVQLGSGANRLHPKILNVDLHPFPDVDCVANCLELPFREGSVDAVYSSALLEHVQDPELALRELFRILRPGGFILTSTPFLQPFHGSPTDFTRWTGTGLEETHRRAGFVSIEVKPDAGPTSALLWILHEYFALILSLGSRRLHTLAWWVILPLLAPFKLMDLLLIHHPLAHKSASTFTLSASKPAPNEGLLTRADN